jgi:hypothetical protein
VSTPSRADLEQKILELRAQLRDAERAAEDADRTAWTVPVEERQAARASVLAQLVDGQLMPLADVARAAGVDEHCALAVLFDLCREGVARRGVKVGGWTLGDERGVRQGGARRRGARGRTPMPPTGHPPGR